MVGESFWPLYHRWSSGVVVNYKRVHCNILSCVVIESCSTTRTQVYSYRSARTIVT